MQQRFLLQILLLAQHVLGTTMPMIRSSRVLYSGCFMWYFVLCFSNTTGSNHLYNNLELLMMSVVVLETC